MTIFRFAAAAFVAVAAGSPSRASAEDGRPPTAVAPIPSFLSDEDYPEEAIRNDEQGTVNYRLSVGADGVVSGCDVTGSSGSALLDETTCRLVTERVRFNPALDAQGKPAPGVVEGRITWKLPPGAKRIDLPERPGAAMQLWLECAWGEAAKLTLSSLDVSTVGSQSLRTCAGLETLARQEIERAAMGELDADRTVRAFREDFLSRLGRRLLDFRLLLTVPPGK